MDERLISEPIAALLDTTADRETPIGEPILPGRFTWRGVEYDVASVLESWKELSPCEHGSGERYVRKHWYRIRTTDGNEMKIYFERRARSSAQAKRRWWLFAIHEPERER